MPGGRGMVALVVGAAVVVALASGGTGLRFPPTAPSDEAARLIRLGGLLAALLGGGALLHLRNRSGARRRDPTLPSIVATAGLMALLAAASVLLPPIDRGPPRIADSAETPPRVTVDPDASGPPPPPSETAPTTEGRGLGQGLPEPEWVPPGSGAAGGASRGLLRGPAPGGSLVLLGLLIGLAVWMALRARREKGPVEEIELPELPQPWSPPGHPGLAPDGAAGFPMEGSDDPAVRDYHRLLDALAAVGLERRAHEAPYEHLRRVSFEGRVDVGSMRELASLYVRTVFGSTLPDEGARASSGVALARSLEGLRAARDRGLQA